MAQSASVFLQRHPRSPMRGMNSRRRQTSESLAPTPSINKLSLPSKATLDLLRLTAKGSIEWWERETAVWNTRPSEKSTFRKHKVCMTSWLSKMSKSKWSLTVWNTPRQLNSLMLMLHLLPWEILSKRRPKRLNSLFSPWKRQPIQTLRLMRKNTGRSKWVLLCNKMLKRWWWRLRATTWPWKRLNSSTWLMKVPLSLNRNREEDSLEPSAICLVVDQRRTRPSPLLKAKC